MDDELSSMFQVAKVLEKLDEDSRARVVRWAADKYGVDLGQPADGEFDPDATDRTMVADVSPEKVAANNAAREQRLHEAKDARKSAPAEASDKPPERDPEKPSFMDTSFRMYSGKQLLKKEKDSKS